MSNLPSPQSSTPPSAPARAPASAPAPPFSPSDPSPSSPAVPPSMPLAVTLSRLRDPVTPSRNLTLHDDDDDLVITRSLRTPRGSRTITIPDDDEEGPVASPSARPRPRLAAPASRILHHPNRDDPTRGWVFMGYTTTATARQVYAQIRTRADGIPVLAWNRIQLVDDVATLVGVHWNEVRLDEGVKDDMGTRGWKIGSAYEEVNPDMLREIKEYVAHQQATLASLQ